jgi:hypothetical protein
MALQIDRAGLDEFCPRLFRALDHLGLLPRSLRAKPTEFEKYSRALLGSIRRYNDVEAGFQEWESRVLRDAPFRKTESYLELQGLRQWMSQQAHLFTDKGNMQHLRSSLYARVFEYLYPRRVLAQAYCIRHQGCLEALKPEFISRELPGSVAEQLQKLQVAYQTEWESIVADAQFALLSNRQYYAKVLSSKDAPDTSPSSDELLVNPKEEE